MIKSIYQRRPFTIQTKKKEVYKPKPMSAGKQVLIQRLLQEYDIETGEDIQDARRAYRFIGWNYPQGMLLIDKTSS